MSEVDKILWLEERIKELENQLEMLLDRIANLETRKAP